MKVVMPASGAGFRGVSYLEGKLLSDPYDVRVAHQKARQKRDPLLSPHGMLRRLQPGNVRHAVEFLQRFGPLTMREEPKEYIQHKVAVRVDLDDFWARQAEFRLFAQLYESRNDQRGLKEAWRELIEQRPVYLKNFIHGLETLAWSLQRSFSDLTELRKRYPNADRMSVGKIIREELRAQERGEEPIKLARAYHPAPIPFPEGPLPSSAVSWFLNDTFASLREGALQLIRSQLDETMRALKPRYVRSGHAWHLSLQFDSLWTMIWDLFAADTVGGPWRICPHCQKPFYPKDRRSMYCTTRQQTLASKRNYIKRIRGKADAA